MGLASVLCRRLPTLCGRHRWLVAGGSASPGDAAFGCRLHEVWACWAWVMVCWCGAYVLKDRSQAQLGFAPAFVAHSVGTPLLLRVGWGDVIRDRARCSGVRCF